jgi:prepilin-type N-terminal cleavage/methylation domain-containing protein
MKRSQRGFTLIEIMLVVVILSILLGVVMTNMSAGYFGLALDSDTETLTHAIWAGQVWAIEHRRPCELEINEDTNEYRLACDLLTGQEPGLLSGDLGEWVALSRGVRFAGVQKAAPGSGNARSICFFPNGRTEASWIRLVCDSGSERVIQVEGQSGVARVLPGKQ